MLSPINISRIFLPFPHSPHFPLRPGIPRIIILLSLELIQQYSAQTFVEVIFHAADNFFEKIRLRAAGAAFGFFFGEVNVEDGVDGVGRGEGDEG